MTCTACNEGRFVHCVPPYGLQAVHDESIDKQPSICLVAHLSETLPAQHFSAEPERGMLGDSREIALQVNNPATDEVIASVACMKAADTKSAIAAAAAAFPSWSHKTAKERGAVLRRCAPPPLSWQS